MDDVGGHGGGPTIKKKPAMNLPKLKKMISETSSTSRGGGQAEEEEEEEEEGNDGVPMSPSPPISPTPSIPMEVWQGMITTDKQKREKFTFAATMIELNPGSSPAPPSFLSTLKDLHVIGRSGVDNVDKYTREPGTRRVYVYGLNVQFDHPAYVRLMAEYETDRRVAVVTLPTGTCYIVPSSLRNDIAVVRQKLEIPTKHPVAILVVKSSSDSTRRNASKSRPAERSASAGRRGPSRARSSSPPVPPQRRAPPNRGGGVRVQPPPATSGSVNDLLGALSSFRGGSSVPGAVPPPPPVYGGQYTYAPPQQQQQQQQHQYQHMAGAPGAQGHQWQGYVQQQQQQQQQQPFRGQVPGGYVPPPPPSTFGTAAPVYGQPPATFNGARGMMPQHQQPRQSQPVGRGRAATLPAWMQNGR